MKTILTFILSLFLLISAGAQTTDYVTTKDFQNEKKKLNEGISSAKKTGLEAKKGFEKQDQTIDSLRGVIKQYQDQLAASDDSVSKLASSVKVLNDNVYQNKTTSRTNFIIAFGFILLVCLFLLIWIFMIKRRSDQNTMALKEDLEKTNKNIAQGFSRTDEHIKDSADGLNRQLQTGLGQIEQKTGQMEQQLGEKIALTEDKLNRYKEEDGLLMKQQQDKIHALQSSFESKMKELSSKIDALEKFQKGIEPGFTEKMDALKLQLEQKIQSVSAAASKTGK